MGEAGNRVWISGGHGPTHRSHGTLAGARKVRQSASSMAPPSIPTTHCGFSQHPPHKQFPILCSHPPHNHPILTLVRPSCNFCNFKTQWGTVSIMHYDQIFIGDPGIASVVSADHEEHCLVHPTDRRGQQTQIMIMLTPSVRSSNAGFTLIFSPYSIISYMILSRYFVMVWTKIV